MPGPDLEAARIVTLSISHLHPDTIGMLDRCRGDLSEGPSVAVRAEGFLVNTHLGDPEALAHDLRPGLLPSLLHRHPDLVLLRALGRGLGAEWLNIDTDGVEYFDILPTYGTGRSSRPTDRAWAEAIGDARLPSGAFLPDPEFLARLERGWSPEEPEDGPAP